MFNLIKNIDKYIFIHNTASTGNIFSIESIENQFNFNKNDILNIEDLADPKYKGKTPKEIRQIWKNENNCCIFWSRHKC